MALCQKENIGVIPYSPLAGGFLTGKYKREEGAPPQSRGYGNDRMKPYMNSEGYAIVAALSEIAETHNATIAQIAIAWLLANPTITSAIIGANNVPQLVDTVKAAEVVLTLEEKVRLDNLSSPT